MLFLGSAMPGWSQTPGAPFHLSIEPTPDSNVSLNRDNPLLQVNLPGPVYDQPVSVYAIIRDQYGNYVTHARHTAWWSTDTAVAQVARGDTLTGEGVIGAGAIEGSTYVVAYDSQFAGTDTVLVVVSNCCLGLSSTPDPVASGTLSLSGHTLRIPQYMVSRSTVAELLDLSGRLVLRFVLSNTAEEALAQPAGTVPKVLRLTSASGATLVTRVANP
jgi:hypothetical protein